MLIIDQTVEQSDIRMFLLFDKLQIVTDCSPLHKNVTLCVKIVEQPVMDWEYDLLK